MTVSFAVDSLGMDRKKGALILGDVTILNYSVFDFVGMITDNILLPLGGVTMCYYIGWKWNPRYLVDELEKDGVKFKLAGLWIFCAGAGCYIYWILWDLFGGAGVGLATGPDKYKRIIPWRLYIGL